MTDVAWRVRLPGFDPVIIFRETKAAARIAAVNGWRDAGYGDRGKWPSGMTVERAPERDSVTQTRKDRCYNERYIGGSP